MSFLNIPGPCHESWSEMSPAEKGRFCSSCKKVVHDLRTSSYADIVDEFRMSSGNMCGRITSKQLHEGFVSQQLKKTWITNARNFSFALLLAFGSSLFVIKQASANTVLSRLRTEIRSMMPDSIKNDVVIKGTVKDKDNGELLPFVNVLLYSGDTMITGAATDLDGAFTIKTSSAGHSHLSLKVNYIGYEPIIMSIDPGAKETNILLDLDMSGEILGDIIMIVDPDEIDLDKLDGTKHTVKRERYKRMPH